MTTAEQIKRDYRGHLDMMLAEAQTWAIDVPCSYWIGHDSFPCYVFQDGSALEFKVRHGFAHQAKIAA